MNLNIVNLDPTEWDKQTWRDAYAGYCERKPYGEMTKREYYDWVLARHKKMTPQPLSDELKRKWTIGKRNARLWAKKHGCDMNGRLLSGVAREQRDKDALETALRAEEIAIDTAEKMSYYEEAKGRKTKWRNGSQS
jgi:hypothetical protein